jgi:hypothetical protein
MNPFDDPSQRTGFEDDEPIEDDGEPLSVEEEEESSGPDDGYDMQMPGKRPRGASYGGKYPASKRWAAKRKPKVPDTDLAQYFGSIPAEKQIAICRAYASYLAAQHRGSTAAQKKTE